MSNRRKQHREKRETNTREAAELKRENEKLKRQVARLTKELSRCENPDDPEEAEEVAEVKPTCPECGSDKLTVFVTPSGANRYGCRSCKKWRGVISL